MNSKTGAVDPSTHARSDTSLGRADRASAGGVVGEGREAAAARAQLNRLMGELQDVRKQLSISEYSNFGGTPHDFA